MLNPATDRLQVVPRASIVMTVVALTTSVAGCARTVAPEFDDVAPPPVMTCQWSAGTPVIVPDTRGAYPANSLLEIGGAVWLGYTSSTDSRTAYEYRIRSLGRDGTPGMDHVITRADFGAMASYTTGPTFLAAHGSDRVALVYDSINGCRLFHLGAQAEVGSPTPISTQLCLDLASTPRGTRL